MQNALRFCRMSGQAELQPFFCKLCAWEQVGQATSAVCELEGLAGHRLDARFDSDTNAQITVRNAEKSIAAEVSCCEPYAGKRLVQLN